VRSRFKPLGDLPRGILAVALEQTIDQATLAFASRDRVWRVSSRQARALARDRHDAIEEFVFRHLQGS
jgi:hypothetical protein